MAEVTLYRIVKSNPPTLIDFLSNREKGNSRRRNESEEIWSGLSHYDNLPQATETARTFPQLGAFAAAMSLDDGRFRIERTFRQGHYTVWGAAHELLDAVEFVVSVR